MQKRLDSMASIAIPHRSGLQDTRLKYNYFLRHSKNSVLFLSFPLCLEPYNTSTEISETCHFNIRNVQFKCMKYATATTLRNNLSANLDLVENIRDFLLVSKRGKLTSALVNIDLFEELLELADKSYVDSIKTARQEYENGEVFNMDAVFPEL